MDVGGRGLLHLGLGLEHPFLVLDEPALEITDRREILVELFLVAFAELSCNFFGLSLDGVENAASLFEPADLACTSEGVPSTNSCWNAFDGENSAGSGTPLADQESDSLPELRIRLGKRVSLPIFSAIG